MVHSYVIAEEIERVFRGQICQPLGEGKDTIREIGQETTKKKAAFYCTLEVLEKLELTWMQLRMGNRKLTKSELVQTALEAMLREYQQCQESTRLHLCPIGPP